MTKKRAVLDTNIYLSAIIFGGNPRKILEAAKEGKVSVFISPAILLEIALKLKKKFFWSEDRVVFVIKAIGKLVELVKPKRKISAVSKDKSDNKILEAASEAGAEFIITGDRHLLELEKFEKIKILKPAAFCQKFL